MFIFLVAPEPLIVRQTGGSRLTDRLTAKAGEELNLECVSEGGNPVPKLSWLVNGARLETTLDQENTGLPGGFWKSISTLRLPVSRVDNGAIVACESQHSALENPITALINFEIFFSPRIEVMTSNTGPLVEESDVTLFCGAEANPTARNIWKRLETGDTNIVRITTSSISCISLIR